MRNRAAEIRQALAEYLDAVDGCDLLARMNASIKVQGLLADLEETDRLTERDGVTILEGFQSIQKRHHPDSTEILNETPEAIW